MIVLAGTIILSVNNLMINQASKAIDDINEAQLRQFAEIAWSDAVYNGVEEAKLNEVISEELIKVGFTYDELIKYKIEATYNNISIVKKYLGPTLGQLVKNAEDYGKKVNYLANGVSEWKVFYKTEDYVYLIASERLEFDQMPTDITGTITSKVSVLMGDKERIFGSISWSKAPSDATEITNASRWMANWNNSNYKSGYNAKCVSYFLNERYWEEFKNTEDYIDEYGETYVVGAIGTPTVEMFIASWNEKLEATGKKEIYNKKLSLQKNGTVGYYVNKEGTTTSLSQSINTEDDLYIWSDVANTGVWLAAPSGKSTSYMLYLYNGGGIYYGRFTNKNYGIRPVICIRSNIPAKLVGETIQLIKNEDN